MKKCTSCQEHLPDSSFPVKKWMNKDGSTTKSKRSKCRLCLNKENTARYHSNPSTKRSHKEAAYRYNIKKYGLTVEQYEQMHSAQEGKCRICQCSPERLSVDHCHKTGAVRGLLCGKCNSALGMVDDSADVLKNMIEYVGRYRDALHT